MSAWASEKRFCPPRRRWASSVSCRTSRRRTNTAIHCTENCIIIIPCLTWSQRRPLCCYQRSAAAATGCELTTYVDRLGGSGAVQNSLAIFWGGKEEIQTPPRAKWSLLIPATWHTTNTAQPLNWAFAFRRGRNGCSHSQAFDRAKLLDKSGRSGGVGIGVCEGLGGIRGWSRVKQGNLKSVVNSSKSNKKGNPSCSRLRLLRSLSVYFTASGTGFYCRAPDNLLPNSKLQPNKPARRRMGFMA